MHGYDDCLARAERSARAAYSAPGRYYHGEQHLDQCLADLDSVPGLEGRDRRLLKWAILWHDVVYDPGRSDNEERSAGLAVSELTACGIPRDDVAEVGRLILLTRSHEAAPGDRIGALIVSIDLSILGSGPERYRNYVRQVRSEYWHLSENDWRSGRSAVLERLLARSPLYPDPAFGARLEDRARANMEAELRALGEG